MKFSTISRVLSLLSVIFFVGLVNASHFRYGTVHWIPSADAKSVTFYLDVAYRGNFAYFDPSKGRMGKSNPPFTPNAEPSNLYSCSNTVGPQSETLCQGTLPQVGDVLYPNSYARTASQYNAAFQQAGTFCWQTSPGRAYNDNSYSCAWIWATVTQIDNTASGNYIIASFNYSASFAGTSGFYNFVYYDINRLDNSFGLQNNYGVPWSLYGTFELSNTKVNGQWNQGPRSAMVPILQIYRKYINKIGIYASDDGPTSALTYAMAPANKLCYQTSCSLLPGASIATPSTPVFTVDTTASIYTSCVATATVPCYFQTQLTISDATTSIPIDFLIVLVENAPVTCDKSCSNAGSVCTDDTGCYNCATSVPGSRTCHPTGALPYFISPTPNNNAIVNFTALNSNNVTIKAISNDTTVTSLYLSTPNTPAGTTSSVWGNTVGNNPAQKTLSWKPSLADVGEYAVTISVKDNNGLVMLGSAQGFFINVIAPVCGYGTPNQNGVCQCPKYDGVKSGFDSTCSTCLPGYYGSNCVPCPNCTHGTCTDGLYGTGQCFCANGWSGPYCNASLQAYCNNGLGSAIISQVNTTNYVTVSSVNAYVASNQQFSQLQVPITITVPQTVLLDVLVLVDVAYGYTTSNGGSKSNLASYASSFFNSLQTYSASMQLGAATFDGNGAFTSYLTVSVAQSGSNLQDAFTNKFPSTASTNNVVSGNRQIKAVLNAISSTTSWRPSAFKIIAVLTGQNVTYTPSDVSALQAACLSANIVPVFVLSSLTSAVDVGTYNNLVSSLKFGAAGKTAVAYQTYASDVPSVISKVLQTIVPLTAYDPDGFVNSLVPASQGINLPSTSQVQVGLLYPSNNAFTGIPQIVINVMGYGTTSFTLSVNHAPTNSSPPPQSVSFARASANNVIYPAVSDEDNNFLTLFYASLPTGSIITTPSSATPVTVGTGYSLSTPSSPSLYWNPPSVSNSAWYGSTSFTYNVTDGCLWSQLQTVNIVVPYTPGTPTCGSFTVNAYENRPLIIQITGGTDWDTPSSQLVYTLTNTPNINAGLSQVSGAAIKSLPAVAAGQQFIYRPNTNYFTQSGTGSDSITYTVTNAGGNSNSNSGDPCTIFINVIHVNLQPAVYPSQISLARGATGTVTLTNTDADSPSLPETATYYISSVTTGPSNAAVTIGYGQSTSNSISATYPIQLSSAVSLANGGSSFPISVTVPNSATAGTWVTINYYVIDSNNSMSGVASVSVNVIAANPPTATSTSVRTPLGTNSSNFVLNGTAVDAADVGALTVTITSLPTMSKLYASGIQINTTGGSFPAGSNFYIVPGAVGSSSYGPDSFTFTVTGRPYGGVTSQPGTVSIYVLFVNSPPSIWTIPQSGLQGTLYNLSSSVNGNDVDDGQTLTAYITNFPVNGILTQFGTTTPINPCANGVFTPSSPCAIPATTQSGSTTSVFSVSYLPNPNFFTNYNFNRNAVPGVNPDTFTAFVLDGFVGSSNTAGPSPGNSSTATVSITVYEAEVPPTAVGTSKNVPRYDVYNSQVSSYQLTLNATTVMAEGSTFTAQIISLPDSALVSSVTTPDGKIVSVGQNISAFTLTFNLVKYAFGQATLNFIVADQSGTTSLNTATATLNVAFVNIPPTCKFAPTPSAATGLIPLSRNVSLNTQFELSVVDPDIQQQFTWNIFGYNTSSVTPGQNNSYIQYNGANLQVGGNVNIPNQNVSAVFSTYFFGNGVAAAGASTYWTGFNFSVTDGIATSFCYVPISVTSKGAPVANPVAPIYTPECSNTECNSNGTRTISGTDDVTPTPYLLTLPQYGTLYDSATNQPITASNYQESGPFYYKPQPYYVGTDSYTYYVQDAEGSSSPKLTGLIYVTYVPYPPIAQFNGPLSTPEETPLGINVAINNIVAFKNDGVTPNPTATVYISAFTTANSVPGNLYQYTTGSAVDSYANAGSNLNVGSTSVALTNTSWSFIYVPPANTYGPALSNVTFFVTDVNGLSSNSITFPISVTFVPKYPVPVNSLVTFAQNTPTATAAPLTITDPNNYHDGPTVLIATIKSLPASFVTLVTSNGTAVKSEMTFTAINGVVNDIFVITTNPGAYTSGNTSFTFSATNNWLTSLNVATVNIVVTPIVLKPSALATTPITVTRTIPYTFNISGFDPQPNNTMSLIYSSSTISSIGGSFSDAQSNVISSSSSVLASGFETGSLISSASFTAPALAVGNDYATFTFFSQIATVQSDPFTVIVNIAPNNPPTANPVNVSCLEDSFTSAFSLNANDLDVADQGSLQFNLTSLPSSSVGELLVNGAPAVINTLYSVNADTLVFKPVPLTNGVEGFYGTVQFYFKSCDQLGAQSAATLVTVNVIHINHQPTASANPINTTMNTQGFFTVAYADVDKLDSPSVAYIQILSTNGLSGQLITTTGQQVTAPFTGAPGVFSFLFRPNVNTFGYLGSITLEYNDGQNATNSASAIVTVPIYYTETFVAPVGNNVNVTTNQGTPVSVIIPGSDIDSPIVTVTIVNFPSGGTVNRTDGTQVTSANPTISCTVPSVTSPNLNQANVIQNYTAVCSAVYVPYASTITDDSFTYTISDTTGLISSTYTATVGVIANRPPPIVVPIPNYPVVNNTVMIIDVLENSLTIFSVSGKSQDGDIVGYPYSWRLYLTSTVATGSLQFYNTNANGTFAVQNVVNISSNGTLFYASSNVYTFKYQPPVNVFGNNFANFQFFVKDNNGNSAIWTIVFNVIHVPQAPVLSALTYTVINSTQQAVTAGSAPHWDFVAALPVVGVENMDVVITWNATSIDVDTGVIPWSSLESILVLSPQKGTFFAGHLLADGSYQIGSELPKKNITSSVSNTIIVPRDTNADGLWRVVFRPLPFDHAYVYTTFTVEAMDTKQPGNLTSLVRTANIRIKSVPRPPTAEWLLPGAVNNHTEVQLTANSVILSGNVTAVDAGVNPIAMNVSIVRVDGKAIQNENVTLSGAVTQGSKKKCTYYNASSITCKDNTIKLNSYLSQVTLDNLQTGVVYNVILAANSLGAGADQGETALYSIEVTDVAVVTVQPAVIVAPKKVGNNNALAGIIAGASVAGAFAAFGAFRLIRKSNPPITGFFGEEAFAGNAITDNPLYEQSGGNFDNPLYASETA